MGQIFNLPNFPAENITDITELTADVNAGVDTIAVEGVKGMSVNDFGVISSLGGIGGEIAKIQTITNLSIKFFTNLINAHRKTEPFTTIFGDQIRGYRVAADNSGYPPTDATFLANVLATFNIDQDSPITQFVDPSGGEGYWYKFVFYNSVSHNITPIQNAFLFRGGRSRNYCSNEDTRNEAGLLTNQQIADTQIDFRRSQADSEIDSSLLAAGYTLPLKDQRNVLYYPPLINNISRMLSAGYVLIQDYGPIAEGNSKDGADKLKEAKSLLKDLQNHDKILVDLAGNMMAMTQRVRGYPDDTTASNGPNGVPEAPLFTMSKKY